MISGKGPDLLDKAKQLGADDALAKPFTADELTVVVERLLA